MSTAPELERLRARLDGGRAAIRARHDGGAPGREVVRATSDLVDEVVRARFAEVLAAHGSPAGFALAAIGGYGRRELSPRSDVDLLLLHDAAVPEALAKGVAEALFTPLWDLKLELGAAARTPAACAELAATDHTARTALLDCRHLDGDRAVYAELERLVLRGLTTAQVDELVTAKAEELARRRQRFGGSVHVLEPNVKNSPGALRDLQAALWMARARFKAAGLSDLLALGILPPREVERLKQARDLLWRVRNGLHYLSNRKEDHLTFDRQEQIAAQLGYRDRVPEGLAVEQFMRDYYLAAEAIRRLADDLVERCQERAELPGATAAPQTRAVAPGLKVWRGRLTFDGTDALAADPSLFVRLFTTAEDLGVPIYAWARDHVRESATRIDDALRRDERVTGALKAAFARLTRADWLRQMHREGVLGALLPEFGRITAKHQHDLYHVYTVDSHSIFAVQRLGALAQGELLEEQPLLSHVIREQPRPLALALGVLFHDAGKGLGGDHSVKGAELVRKVCERLAVPARDASDAEFLVREHLAMSHVSQRRDLSDPELIASFASKMQDRTRLSMLYVLTYVDMCSVGPQTYTSWKGRLLQELFEKTLAVLDGAPATAEADLHRQALLARGLDPSRADAFLGKVPPRYLTFAEPASAPRALRLLDLGERRALATAVSDDPSERVTVLSIVAADRPGLLSELAGVLTAHRIDILRADVFSTSDGKALDFFVVRGPRGGSLERGRWRAARRDLARVIRREATAKELVARTLKPSSLPKKPLPPVATRVKLDQHAASGFTVIDVFAEDRPGLLHAVTGALHELGLSIAVARIATEGNRAIDSFYVTEAGGRKVAAARAEAIETQVRAALDALPG